MLNVQKFSMRAVTIGYLYLKIIFESIILHTQISTKAPESIIGPKNSYP